MALKEIVVMENRHKKLARADRYNLQILGRISFEKDDGEEESYICNTINISLSGALVETGSLIPLGSLLKYQFCMPGFTIPVNIIGEIVRGERDNHLAATQVSKHQKLNRYGIIFLDMNEEDKMAMETYLMQAKARAIQKKADEPEAEV